MLKKALKKATRAPFKDDEAMEKKAMPRAPFKGYGDEGGDLGVALMSCAKTRKVNQKLVDAINAVPDTYQDAKEALGNLTEEQKNILQMLLTSLYGLASVRTRWNNIPFVIAGSCLYSVGIKVPSVAILQLPTTVILDELFGVLYQPGRVGTRFNSDFKDEIGLYIRKKLPLTQLTQDIQMGKEHLESTLSLADLNDLETVWGQDQVKMWWRNVSEQFLSELRADGATEFLYKELVEKYGGGLID